MIEEEEVAVAGEDEFTASAKVYDGAEGLGERENAVTGVHCPANGTLSGGQHYFLPQRTTSRHK